MFNSFLVISCLVCASITVQLLKRELFTMKIEEAKFKKKFPNSDSTQQKTRHPRNVCLRQHNIQTLVDMTLTFDP